MACIPSTPLVELSQPRPDVAPERHHLKIRPQRQELRLPPQARRPDHRPLGQVGQRQRPRARRPHPGVARILAGGRRRQHQPGRQLGRHVLERVHRQVHLARQERLLELLGEQPLSADFAQRHVQHLIPAGVDDRELHRRDGTAWQRQEPIADVLRLRQRQGRPACTDS
jgi:hypothetical protein